MDKKMLVNYLKAKPDLNLFLNNVIEDKTILDSLFDIAATETSSIKYACTKIIRMVSEKEPELIYPYFEMLAKWIHHKNSFIKWDGIITLSNISAVDDENKFKDIYQDYFALIQDPQMITASNVVGNAWKIVLAKPELENDITKRLLKVPNTVYLHKGNPSPECNYIVCGQVLECFDHYFNSSENQSEMINFAKEQLNSKRKSVVKIAEKFLKQHLCEDKI